jgi:zinc protease
MLRNQVAWAACRPSALTINHKDLVPVKLLNYIAFVFLGSRVFQLREQTGLFYTAFGKFGANAGKTPGFDYIGTLVNPDKVKEAESKIIKTINDLASKGVMNDELDSARQMYLKKLIDATATNKAMAKLFSDIQALNLGFDYYDKVLAKIQTITLKEINAIASRYFSLDNMAYVQVGQMK